jgi:uncharacterized protein YkwD
METKALHVALALSLIALSLSSALPEAAIAGPPELADEPPTFAYLPPVKDPPAPIQLLEYPPDPTADIEWSAGTSGVTDIQTAFNNARTVENAQLGTSIPMLTLPSQAEWNAKSDGEKALWLINRERIDRGVHPLHGLEANVTSVAQYYAEYLIDHNAFGHYEDGRSPWERLNDNPAIGACHDFLSVAENLFVFWTSGTSIPLPVEQAIYYWMYKDSGSGWGHRHAILWYPYTDNSGPVGSEGFLGLGRDNGPHQGWNYAELIVMNVFDPCATWDYGVDAVLGNLPDAVEFAYSIPDQRLLPTSKQVTPRNTGTDETLTWEIAKTGAWFSALPVTGNTPASFWITPTTFITNSENIYTGKVTVTVTNPAGVSGSPHEIDLTLRVVDSSFSIIYLPVVMKN